MSIIIDLVIIAIIALCVLVGYHKGLTGSLLKIVSFVLALIIAFILFKPVSNFIIDKTDWDENLEQAIRQSILKDEEKTNDETQKENMPEVITDYINNAVEKAGNEAKTAIVDSTAREVAIMIINIAVAIALFIVSKIILLLVKGLANLLTKLPVIKHLTQFIEENDEDYIIETIEVLEAMTEISSLKDEELDVIGELISNMYGALEVNKLVKTGTDKKEALNTFMKRVLGSIDK